MINTNDIHTLVKEYIHGVNGLPSIREMDATTNGQWRIKVT